MNKLVLVVLAFGAGLLTGLYVWGSTDVRITKEIEDMVRSSPSLLGQRHDVEKKELDAAEITQRLIGTWQSVDDPKFTRAFLIDSSLIDTYESSAQSSEESRWAVFTAPEGEPPPFPIPTGTVYLKVSSVEEVLYFKILEVTPETLTLVYLDGGGVQKFVKKN